MTDVLRRREFLKQSLAASATLAGARQRVLGANDRVRVALIGAGRQGRGLLRGFAEHKDVQIVGVCDVYAPQLPLAVAEARLAGDVKTYKDFRQLLDNQDVDAVIVASPDHWHALHTVMACQAGKDVYVEKPVSHNVVEGRRIVEFAAKTNRICQTGTQSRSQPGIHEAIDYARTKIGHVQLVHGICYKLRPSIGKVDADQAPPPTMDYDLWCGPAPNKPPHRRTSNGTVHYDWHWIWDYGNGDLGNQGIHQMDVARWGLGKSTLPKEVVSVGGRLGYEDDGETPNSQLSQLVWNDARILFEVRGLPTGSPWPAAVNELEKKGSNFMGDIFYGKEGTVVICNSGVSYALDPKGAVVKVFKGEGDHFANFVAAVRSRKRESLHADIVEGHLSSAMCHLANISYRLGDKWGVGQDARAMGFGEEGKEWEIAIGLVEHLRRDHKLAGGKEWSVGHSLRFDAGKEQFIGDYSGEANVLLSREYREGFELPKTA